MSFYEVIKAFERAIKALCSPEYTPLLEVKF
jgi:hypothetical protein